MKDADTRLIEIVRKGSSDTDTESAQNITEHRTDRERNLFSSGERKIREKKRERKKARKCDMQWQF